MASMGKSPKIPITPSLWKSAGHQEVAKVQAEAENVAIVTSEVHHCGTVEDAAPVSGGGGPTVIFIGLEPPLSFIYIHTYIYIYTYVYVHVYIYIYISNMDISTINSSCWSYKPTCLTTGNQPVG